MSENTKIKVYGIDLGTTYSAISHVGDSGNVEIINNPDGGSITASAVFFEDGGIVVGEGAKESAYTDPDNFVHLIKREMGTTWRKTFLDKEHSPESISSLILKYMVKGAEMSGHEVKDVVITCPAYFNEAERMATKAAGVLAKLNVLAVVDEPIAAAISYGMGITGNDQGETQETRQIIVYDLGGGTFDVTVVEISPKGVKVICSDGDHKLGGADWDAALRDLLLEKLLIENPEAGDLMADPETRAALITTVEKTKMSLSQKETATARITCCDGSKSKVSVTREEFNEATQPLLNRTIEFTDAMIAMAREKTGVEKIDEFLLVGGSTYMPQVMEMVNSRYKDTLRVEPKLYEPNHAVSKGAALYGNNKAIRDLYEKVLKDLKEKNPDTPTGKLEDEANKKVADEFSLAPETIETAVNTEMITVASKSIGIRVKNKEGKFVCYNLIEKQNEVPCNNTQAFPVSAANAATLPLIVYSNNIVGKQADLDCCLELGKATMELTPGLPAGAPIEVTFALDPEGRLELTARDVTNDKKIVVPFQVEGVLSEEERKKLEEVVADLEMVD